VNDSVANCCFYQLLGEFLLQVVNLMSIYFRVLRHLLPSCHCEAGLYDDCQSHSMMLLLGNYRLLLRREQVHKVACNHLLTTEVRLQPMQTSETAWCWFAMDYSEDEPAMQNFACRFKVCC